MDADRIALNASGGALGFPPSATSSAAEQKACEFVEPAAIATDNGQCVHGLLESCDGFGGSLAGESSCAAAEWTCAAE